MASRPWCFGSACRSRRFRRLPPKSRPTWSGVALEYLGELRTRPSMGCADRANELMKSHSITFVRSGFLRPLTKLRLIGRGLRALARPRIGRLEGPGTKPPKVFSAPAGTGRTRNFNCTARVRFSIKTPISSITIHASSSRSFARLGSRSGDDKLC